MMLFIVHDMEMGVCKDTSETFISNFTANFIIQSKIEFDSLGLKYKECFNKSFPVMFEMETTFVRIKFNYMLLN